MEMKRKQKHISLRCTNQVFTMIELLVAMVVSLLAMAAIYSTFLSQSILFFFTISVLCGDRTFSKT